MVHALAIVSVHGNQMLCGAQGSDGQSVGRWDKLLALCAASPHTKQREHFYSECRSFISSPFWASHNVSHRDYSVH